MKSKLKLKKAICTSNKTSHTDHLLLRVIRHKANHSEIWRLCEKVTPLRIYQFDKVKRHRDGGVYYRIFYNDDFYITITKRAFRRHFREVK